MKSIVLIAPSEEILRIGKSLQRKSFSDIRVCLGLIQEGVREAQKKSRSGAEIFVTRARTAEAIKKAEVPGVVVKIPITAYDVLRAISQARKTSEKIAIVAFSEMVGSIDALSELLNMNLLVFLYEEENQADGMLDKALAKGAEVIIGGETTKRATERRGIPFVQLITGEEAISQALDEARRINEVRLQEKTRLRLLEAVAHYSGEGILILDKDLKISMCNGTLSEMSSLKEEEIIGKWLKEIWPEVEPKKVFSGSESQYDELVVFRGLEVLCNKTTIRVGKEITGLVLSFQAVEAIRKKEAKLRRSIYTEEYQGKSSFEDILGESGEIKKAVQIGKEFALTESPVFLVGATGVGKDIFAQSIHRYSHRSSGAYVGVKCSLLIGAAFDREIYGTVGSENSPGKPGLFEIAHKGTLFLNEITELDIESQGKLLDVIQQKKVARMGGRSPLPIDVRIVVATSQDIRKAIHEGRFRADLYYQLNVLQLNIPSLAKRRGDIWILAKAFLEKLASRKKKKMYLEEEALMVLYRHSWSGNVRELLNVMERVAVTCHEEKVSKSYLQSLLEHDLSPETSSAREILKYDQIETIRAALKECRGNYGLTAKKLGIDRSTLWRRLKKLGLK